MKKQTDRTGLVPYPAPTRVFNRNFLIVMLANFGLCLGHFSVYPLVASYTGLLNATPTLAGFLVGMFYAVALGLRPVSGPIITHIDKRKLLIVIFSIGIITNAAYAVFSNLYAFAVFRVLNGIQYGFVGPLIMTLAADHTPADKMETGIGLYGVGGAVGQSVAALIANALRDFGTKYKLARSFSELESELYGFRLVFIFAAVVFALSSAAAFLLPPDKKTKAETGSLGKWYKSIATKHAIGIAAAVFFVVFSYSFYSSYIVKFAEERAIPNIALFFTVVSITLLVTRPLSGFLNHRYGFKRVIIPAAIIFLSSFVIVSTSHSTLQTCIGAGVAALGYGACQPSLQAMAVLTVPPLQRGLASNTLYIGMDLGFFLGPLVGGVMLETMSYGKMYLFGMIPVIIGIIVLIIIFPAFTRRRKELENTANLENISDA